MNAEETKVLSFSCSRGHFEFECVLTFNKGHSKSFSFCISELFAVCNVYARMTFTLQST
jgi:hypothetical protein